MTKKKTTKKKAAPKLLSSVQYNGKRGWGRATVLRVDGATLALATPWDGLQKGVKRGKASGTYK